MKQKDRVFNKEILEKGTQLGKDWSNEALGSFVVMMILAIATAIAIIVNQ